MKIREDGALFGHPKGLYTGTGILLYRRRLKRTDGKLISRM